MERTVARSVLSLVLGGSWVHAEAREAALGEGSPFLIVLGFRAYIYPWLNQ